MKSPPIEENTLPDNTGTTLKLISQDSVATKGALYESTKGLGFGGRRVEITDQALLNP